MLALNKKTDYGLIALCCLAAQPDQVHSARSIAQTYGMSLSLLMNVLKDLQRDGLVDSIRGSRGGYRLARPAQQISLAQLIQALQGAPRLVACLSEDSEKSDADHFCDLALRCPVQSPARKVHLKLQDLFNNISLADLIDEKSDLLVATGE
jgi:Rrf2 family protein